MVFGSSGIIEVVCGPMFSGKTEELIRRVRRAEIARQRVQIFKPSIDDRYHMTQVVSHSSQSVEAQVVSSSLEILQGLFDTTRIVAIDEVQFFDKDIIRVVEKLARRGCRVICAGLDQDYRGRPFGPIPQLLAIADRVDKVQAVCTVCGNEASKSFRRAAKGKDGKTILVGEADIYEARCREHFDFHTVEDEDDLLAFGPFLEPLKPSLAEEKA